MKITYSTIILLVSFYSLQAQTKIAIPKGFTPIIVQRPADFEYLSAPDSLGNKSLLKMPKSNVKSTNDVILPQIPYPIVFIHGLNSNSDKWINNGNFFYNNYGLSYGGRFDFCLNFDGNYYSANQDFYSTSTPNADIALFNGTWVNGDYFLVNFDVGLNGAFHPNGSSYDVLSNQSAITKQGKALAWAIQLVLETTGRDKVILMGHSMGGLAAREYLQNWTQSDGQHHVAKLVTTGTPHGGSNSTSFGFSVGGVNEQSEAIRDLRRTYYYSGDYGVFLWGGLELQDNDNHMDDNFNLNGVDFYNVDVNCNGVTDETITGLNQKNIPTDLDYSCIVGECSGCLIDPNPGDGVVWDYWANLNNIYNLTVNPTFNLFNYYASATTEIHSDLPFQTYENMQGLDEPNEFVLAYQIGIDTSYLGFTTVQPTGGYQYDYDDYKFSISTASTLTLSISNIYLANLQAHIIDANGNQIGPLLQSNGATTINYLYAIGTGDYFLEIYGTPTTYSYLYPYSYMLSTNPIVTDNGNNTINDKIIIYPNPTSSFVTIDGIKQNSKIRIFDIIGKTVYQTTTTSNIQIQLNELNDGLYTLQIETDDKITNYKIQISHN